MTKIMGHGNIYLFLEHQEEFQVLPRQCPEKYSPHCLRMADLQCSKVIQITTHEAIENQWQILDVAIRERQITNKAQFKTALNEEWASISTDVTSKLFKLKQEHTEAVILNNGNPTTK